MIGGIDGSIATILAAIIAALLAGIAVYYQQRNRRSDKLDAEVLQRTSNKVRETELALEAWRELVRANAATLSEQTRQLEALRVRAQRAEDENLKLKEELAVTKIVLVDTKAEVARLQVKVAQLERTVP